MDRQQRHLLFLRHVLEIAVKHEAGRTVLDDDWLFAGIDSEVEQYGRAVLDGLSGPEIGRQLGWSERRAHRVYCRWRRYLRDLSTTRAACGIVRADPSRTAQYRTFFDPDGRRLGYWEHTETIQ